MVFISKNDEKKLLGKPFQPYPSSRFYHYGYVYPNVKVAPSFVKQCYPRI